MQTQKASKAAERKAILSQIEGFTRYTKRMLESPKYQKLEAKREKECKAKKEREQKELKNLIREEIIAVLSSKAFIRELKVRMKA